MNIGECGCMGGGLVIGKCVDVGVGVGGVGGRY